VLGEDLPLRRAMTANPRLQVLVACGYYDLVCAYAGNARLVSELEPALRQNVAAKAYGGGHAIYTDEAAKREFKKDVASFVRSALGGPTGRR
jgi:carboxypeptidase C (cathepsin A)